ncbi:MAG TPA: substrate-binding domain-containing protein [Fimbriimonas sp.]|nr:substrate-binding domain-containing protein [Fimbriimonas sp.]
MRVWNGIALGALALAAIVGCNGGGGDNTSAATAGSTATANGTAGGKGTGLKSLKITMIAKSNNNPVFQSAKVGAEKAAADLTKETGCQISIDWQTPETEDGQVQAQKIQQAANEGANAILISCSDASKVKGAIDDAVDKGIPVMTFDSDAPDSKRFAFYGADDTAVGVQVMDELAKAANGQQLQVAILAGNQTAPNLKKRAQGVIDEAKKYPNVHIVETFHHKETPQDATAEVQRDNLAYPKINAWAMVGGWPLFNSALLSLDPAKYKIVAVDALPAELPYVDKGIAPVLLAQPTFDWGYKSVGFIVDKLVKGKNVDTINVMQLVRVSKDNLGDWAKQLKDWGMPGIDPKYLNMPSAKSDASKK